MVTMSMSMSMSMSMMIGSSTGYRFVVTRTAAGSCMLYTEQNVCTSYGPLSCNKGTIISIYFFVDSEQHHRSSRHGSFHHYIPPLYIASKVGCICDGWQNQVYRLDLVVAISFAYPFVFASIHIRNTQTEYIEALIL
jgi:hypothetical protein